MVSSSKTERLDTHLCLVLEQSLLCSVFTTVEWIWGKNLYCICVKLQNISGLDLMLYSHVFPNFLFIAPCIIAKQCSLPITGTTEQHKQPLNSSRHPSPTRKHNHSSVTTGRCCRESLSQGKPKRLIPLAGTWKWTHALKVRKQGESTVKSFGHDSKVKNLTA